MRNFGYSPMYYHASFWPEGFISLLINVLVWGAVIYLVMMLIRTLSGKHHRGCCGMPSNSNLEEGEKSSYLDIIKERYAKGDIDKKQYEELKKDLSE